LWKIGSFKLYCGKLIQIMVVNKLIQTLLIHCNILWKIDSFTLTVENWFMNAFSLIMENWFVYAFCGKLIHSLSLPWKIYYHSNFKFRLIAENWLKPNICWKLMKVLEENWLKLLKENWPKKLIVENKIKAYFFINIGNWVPENLLNKIDFVCWNGFSVEKQVFPICKIFHGFETSTNV
jgi:hypothetical protein